MSTTSSSTVSIEHSDKELEENIYSYLRRREMLIQYLDNQIEAIDNFHNEMLEWMVNTQLKLKIENETLFMAYSMITRYLRIKKVTQYEFLILCFSSLIIASKYNKRCSPHLEKFLATTNNLLSKAEVIKTELTILQLFNFNISFPTVFDFLQRFSKLMGLDERVFKFALFICELQALNLSMTRYRPSLIAAGSLYLAEKAINKRTEMVLSEIDYEEEEVEQCTKELLINMLSKKRTISASIKRKYKDIAGIELDENIFTS